MPTQEPSRREFLKTTALSTLGWTVVGSKALTLAEENFDLIVVGAGTAGMPCAISAAEMGAKVLVIEKSNQVGGTLHLTGGHMSAGGTKHQLKHNITDSPQAHFEDVMRISKNTAPPELVRLAVEEAPHTIDWLDGLGFEFAPDSPRIVHGHVPYQVARTQYGKDAGKSILKAIMPEWNKWVQTGQIKLLLEQELTDLIKKGNRITGVQTKSATGLNTWQGKKVVLTTGGYAANHRMFALKHPGTNRLITAAARTSTGEGISIAEKHGAQFWNADKHISSLGGIEVEPQSGWADFWDGWAMVFTTAYRPTKEIYVNSYGVRFMDEANPDPDYRERIVSKQPGGKFWVIFEQKNLFETQPSIVPKWDINRVFNEANRGKCVWWGHTIEELAKRANLPTMMLKQTIDDYNAMTTDGTDIDFKRNKETLLPITEGPYFAILTYATSLISFGGLVVNTKLQVLDNQGKAIHNLYAAGEILGAGATTGNAFCGGMLVTPAMSFGRILGRSLSKS